MSEQKQGRNAGVQQHKPRQRKPEALTKRNEDYVFRLKKALAETKLSPEKQEEAIEDMIPQLLISQKNGQTARQLFGTVTERVNEIVEGPHKKADAKQNKWLLFMDSSLMIFMVFNFMYGIMFFFSKSTKTQAGQAGILSLLIISLVGGYGIMLMQMNLQPSKDGKRRRPPIWKLLLYLVSFFIIMVGTYTISMLIPGPINANLPAAAYIAIGAVTLALRIYLKRRFHIQNTVF
uniref:Integral membrane protein n=1 Tax=Loigolactobacillus rennini TaxID=238013 RepID=A0A1K2I9B7_9LACO|nr:Integral membrane protein [Loigolactobacillus rennini]